MVCNPVNAATGNKYQRETDYFGGGRFPLEFTRTYNSVALPWVGAKPFGPHWTSTYDRAVGYYAVSNPDDATVLRPDGRALTFRRIGGQWVADADIADRLVGVLDAQGTRIGWNYSVTDGEFTELYGVDGRLLSITDRAGRQQTLTYSTAATPPSIAPAAGLLIQVTEDVGWSLSLTYDSAGRLATLTDPAGQLFQYGYDTNGNLVSVTGPDLKIRTYHYENAQFPGALTGITDENGGRFSTYTYDAQGRVTVSEHAGGAERYIFAYTTNSQWDPTQVTDPLGTSRSFGFSLVQKVARFGSLTQQCMTCGASNAAQTYDANGNVASKRDFNGNLTCFAFDLTRNLERVQGEGLTAASCPADMAAWTPATNTVERKITTEWHPTWRLPVKVCEAKRITTLSYDGQGNLTSRSMQATNDAAGGLGCAAAPVGTARTWTYTNTYSATVPGLIIQQVVNGPRTDVSDLTTYLFDAQGRLTSITNALGHVTSIASYDAHGKPLSIVDPNGLTTTMTYDARQRLLARVVGGEATTYEYDGVGQVKKIARPDGSFLSYTYDGAHRLTRIDDNLGNRIVYTLDAMGNRIKEETFDTSGVLTGWLQREYNALSRLTKDIGGTSPATQITQYTYDNQGNVLSVRDPLNRLTQFAYDALNRRTTTTDPANGVVTATYDALDQTIRIKDPRNLQTSYTINGLGDLTGQSSPDTGGVTIIRDSAGNPTSVRYNGSPAWLHSFDALGRLTTVNYQMGANDVFRYDGAPSGTPNALGRMSQMQDSSGLTNWTYDVHGRVTSGPGGTRTYDAAGRLTALFYSPDLTVNYSYDGLGRVNGISVTSWFGTRQILSAVTYRPFGTFSGFTWGDGTTYSRTFDLDGRIRTYTIGTSTRTVTWDDASRITAVQDSLIPQLNATFGYDSLDRLTGYVGFATSHAYTYDATGNRTSIGIGANTYPYSVSSTRNWLLSASGPPPARTLTHNSDGRITNDGITTFTYQGARRLASTFRTGGPTTTYTFNALGQRRSKVTGTTSAGFEYDAAGRLLRESIGGLWRTYLYLGDVPVAFIDDGHDRPYYVWPDHLGTPRMVTEHGRGVRWRWDSTPFGESLPDENPAGLGAFKMNLRFPGQYYDAETGLHYNYFRDYEPQIGRYVQSDPIGLAGGINTYAYVGANPVSISDPHGLDNPGMGPYEPPPVQRSIFEIYDDADRQARRDFPRSTWWNGPGDAFRHCFASCMMTSEHGRGAAETYGWLNEVRGDIWHNQEEGERRMDEFNNAYGRACGGSSPPRRDCLNSCRTPHLIPSYSHGSSPGYWDYRPMY